MLKPEYEPHNWDAFWRTTIGNEATADVAADLAMSTKAIRQARFRILKRLRQELEHLIAPDEIDENFLIS